MQQLVVRIRVTAPALVSTLLCSSMQLMLVSQLSKAAPFEHASVSKPLADLEAKCAKQMPVRTALREGRV